MADNVRPDAVLSAHPLLSAEIDRLRARLAEVEAERGRLAVVADAEEFRAEAAEARLAEVLALCDKAPKFHYRNLPVGDGWLSAAKVRAAARGEGDQ